MCPTTVIDSRALTFWNRLRREPSFSIRTDSPITKTCLYKFDPLKHHFYIVKLGFTGVNIIFLISAQNIHCGYSLEPPRRDGSNEYPQSVLSRDMRRFRIFHLKTFIFLVVKFSVYLNRLVLIIVVQLKREAVLSTIKIRAPYSSSYSV